MNSMVTLAQLGCGYWGPNLLRNAVTNPQAKVAWVADPSAERRAYGELNFPQVKTTAEWNTIFADPGVDAVIIATPATTHYELVRQALLAGNHVLVEKPIAMHTAQADEL